MNPIDWIPAQYRFLAAGLLALLLVGGSVAGTWKVQDWRYGQQLERQARLQSDTLKEISLASSAVQRRENEKRLLLEQQLHVQDQTHYQEVSDAKTSQARLRDRLATADLRLSVLLDATDSAGGCAVPATTDAGGVVHAAHRARLDPAHAQRIIGITGDGDQGLIALAACQEYARTVSTAK
jgi:hypothetical protein